MRSLVMAVALPGLGWAFSSSSIFRRDFLLVAWHHVDGDHMRRLQTYLHRFCIGDGFT